MSAPAVRDLRGAIAAAGALAGVVALAGCGDPQDKGPAPRPIGSIAPAAPRAESAGAEAVPQRHRGKVPAAVEEPPPEDDDDGSPLAPHKPPPGGSTL